MTPEPYSQAWWFRRWLAEMAGGFALCATMVALVVLEPGWVPRGLRGELTIGAVAGSPFFLLIAASSSISQAWGDRGNAVLRVLAVIGLTVAQCALLVLFGLALKD